MAFENPSADVAMWMAKALSSPQLAPLGSGSTRGESGKFECETLGGTEPVPPNSLEACSNSQATPVRHCVKEGCYRHAPTCVDGVSLVK